MRLQFVMVGNLIGYQIDNGEVEFISPKDALEIISQLTLALLKQKHNEDR